MKATRWGLVIAAAILMSVFAGSAHAAAPTPRAQAVVDEPTGSPSPSPSPSSPSDLEEPNKPPFWDVIGRVRYAINQWFAGLVSSALKPVFDLLGRTVFSTPGLASNERIGDLWRFSLGIADAGLLIMVLVGAGIVSLGSSVSSQLTAKELLPRLILAAIAANISLFLLGQMIALSNALSQGMLGAAIDPSQVGGRMAATLGSAALGNPFLALFALVVIVLGILVVVAYVIRIAALVILASAAPLMLAGHVLPQSEGFARSWWRATAALLVAPVIQSMLLAAAFRIFLSGDGVLGLPIGSGLIDLLVVGCLLYLLYKIPFWALNAAMAGAGSRAWVRAKSAARSAATKAAAA